MSKLNGVVQGQNMVNVAQEYKRMSQSVCLNMHAKCDLKQESKQVLEI